MGVFFLLDLPLPKVASQVEQPGLHLGLHESKVVVNVQVIEAPHQELHQPESREPQKELGALVRQVAAGLEVVDDQVEQENGA